MEQKNIIVNCVDFNMMKIGHYPHIFSLNIKIILHKNTMMNFIKKKMKENVKFVESQQNSLI